MSRLELLPALTTDTRPWGQFDLLIHNKPATVKIITVEAGRRLSLQRHAQRDEWWTILDPGLMVENGSEVFEPCVGERVWIPRGKAHRVANVGSAPARFLEIAFGNFDEFDIERLEDDYARFPATAEPRRDWRLGRWLTGHRVAVALSMAVTIGLLYLLQGLLWTHTSAPQGLPERIWNWGALLWLGALLPGVLGLAGNLAFRHPEHLDDVQHIPQLVSLRIVSRGDNVEALTATIRRCQREMARTPLFRYVIEVVTDERSIMLPSPNSDLRYIDVPDDYQTPNGSMFKARALQYALEHSPIPDDAWIVHLDEETHITSSGIKGIATMIAEEEASGELRIGQGAILYHRDWKRHPLLTLADNVRTGDDFARFHFQHRLGVTIFGLHGSFIVTRNDVERSIGFDFGPHGSITEDAFWALRAMQEGRRCRWVDGYLEEQSTQSVRDFLRQRRRWFQGLWKVTLHAPVKLRWRLCLGLNTLLWTIAPFATLYTVAHLFYGSATGSSIRFLANFSFASFTTLYLMGLLANMREHGILGVAAKARWLVAQIALLPLFNLMEGVGVMFAFFKPSNGFHVVKK